MKKSMIISTIAMIVVVVVALSTATYAWFNSSNYTTASVTMTTEASADWTMYKGTTTSETTQKTYTFTGGAQSSIALTAAMSNGLYSPTESISVGLTKAGATALATNAKFYEAKTDGSIVTANSAPAEANVDVIRVVNAKSLGAEASSDERTLLLTVVVNAGDTATSTATKYAGAALSFHIEYIKDADATAQIITNGYGVGTVAASGSTNIATRGSDQGASGTGVRPTYANAGTSSVFEPNVAGDPALGINPNDNVFTYKIDIGAVAFEQGVTFAIYTWIDGWTADSSAQGASFTVTYAFTTKA